VHGRVLHTGGTAGIHAPPVPRARPEWGLRSDPFKRFVFDLKPGASPLFADPIEASTAN